MSLNGGVRSIEVSKSTNLIAVKGDSLNDITLLENVEAVVKGGKLVH